MDFRWLDDPNLDMADRLQHLSIGDLEQARVYLGQRIADIQADLSALPRWADRPRPILSRLRTALERHRMVRDRMASVREAVFEVYHPGRFDGLTGVVDELLHVILKNLDVRSLTPEQQLSVRRGRAVIDAARKDRVWDGQLVGEDNAK
jgi:hypothetical protein